MPTQETLSARPLRGALRSAVLCAKFPRFDSDRLKLRELVFDYNSTYRLFLLRHGEYSQRRVEGKPSVAIVSHADLIGVSN
jgi:hypothetical protein